jgi:hypothetical protein
MRFVFTVILCSALLHSLSPFPRAADAAENSGSPLITTSSKLESAALIAAGDSNLTFKVVNGGERTIAASQVVRWGSFMPAAGGHRVRLSSGGELLAQTVEIRGGEILLDSALLKEIRLRPGLVSVVTFDMPADQAGTQSLEKRITAATVDADTLLLSNGDEISGHLIELTNDKIHFDTTAADVVVDRARATAVVFRRAKATSQVARDQSKTWVGLRDGSCLLVQSVVVKNSSAQLELSGGSAISLPADAVVALQPLGGDVVYVSDLTAVSYRHIPFLSLAWDYRRDRNVTGGPLMAHGERFLKGLGMHSAARITYQLDGQYRAFQSELAIDDSTNGRGSVNCRVFTDDGSGQWRLKYEGPVVRGGAQPITVNVDLAGAKRLSLLVDFADRGDQQDHINWLDARLIQ